MLLGFMFYRILRFKTRLTNTACSIRSINANTWKSGCFIARQSAIMRMWSVPTGEKASYNRDNRLVVMPQKTGYKPGDWIIKSYPTERHFFFPRNMQVARRQSVRSAEQFVVIAGAREANSR